MEKPTKKRKLTAEEQRECDALNAIYKAKKKDLGITQEQIAIEGLGAKTQSAANHYLTGKNALNVEAAAVFARYLQVPVAAFSERLAAEIEGMAESALAGSFMEPGARNSPGAEAVFVGDLSPWDDETPLDNDEVELPLYKEVELAAGAGRTAVREVAGRKLRFSYATLRASGVDPSAAVCAQIKGNSMEPLILDGATIGIDTATTYIIDGEIYALEHEGMLRVKFLYRLPGGGIRLRSFNRDEYGDEEYDAETIQASEISIIGWVFWWSTVRKRKSQTR
ncbi:LexA family transcriptional regulator [Pseudomonas citronellolis]|uniref:LexA family transcriptional regulator n=1 Tax=Pseudomonas citronellolis TaxID=53408 RepID=UPI0023E37A89|nr:helix-turn-helix transcriptional regulator [Pseudomonas citronellolis]MDF3932124.1 helix-turn-helix transcriptional regulator [Pseudomonas citronellolis]